MAASINSLLRGASMDLAASSDDDDGHVPQGGVDTDQEIDPPEATDESKKKD
eukprot:CAMPEP_0119283046 /NCGR_PEP_ID=MMETSP1329-20130426/27791_1 /TAXON_ID=114041 /ORGANISM="Genus nov. species nov., Strain RCC1024" /LENGTH=51 /DNA_ID=CAMNT_0007283711 /DNA_START=126 /DNA_END=278 /DNA_ORIENTATION=-